MPTPGEQIAISGARCQEVKVMSNGLFRVAFLSMALVVAGCGDDSVNPVPPLDAGAKDATADSRADGASHDAPTDTSAEDGHGASDAGTDAADASPE